MMRRVRILLAYGVLLSAVGCFNSRRPTRYLIPSGYVGPIRVEYGIPGAPALGMEEGRYLIRVPASGIVQTSSPLDEGVSEPDDFYYVSGHTRKRLFQHGNPYPVGTIPPTPMIWGGKAGSGTHTPVTQKWFVGTEKQNAEYGKKHPTWP